MARVIVSRLCVVLLAASAASALAQAPATTEVPEQALLPVLNQRSGQLEALLLVEPAGASASPLERIIGRAGPPPLLSRRLTTLGTGALTASLDLDAQPGLALLCDSSAALVTLGALADHCLLAQIDRRAADPLLARTRIGNVAGTLTWGGPEASVTFGLDLSRGQLDAVEALSGPIGLGTDPIAPWSLGSRGTAPVFGGLLSDYRQNRLGFNGRFRLGEEGWLSLGGSLARAQLLPGDGLLLPGAHSWHSNEFTLGGGWGAFSGAITSRVIEVPGQSGQSSALDIALSWRMPWQAQITVGARQLSGGIADPDDPFGMRGLDGRSDGEDRVPYVRYKQDL